MCRLPVTVNGWHTICSQSLSGTTPFHNTAMLLPFERVPRRPYEGPLPHSQVSGLSSRAWGWKSRSLWQPSTGMSSQTSRDPSRLPCILRPNEKGHDLVRLMPRAHGLEVLPRLQSCRVVGTVPPRGPSRGETTSRTKVYRVLDQNRVQHFQSPCIAEAEP